MSKPDDGGPAFPHPNPNYSQDYGWRHRAFGGMTLRDWFAGQALVGMGTWTPGAKANNLPAKAHYAYELADAMLKARSAP